MKGLVSLETWMFTTSRLNVPDAQTQMQGQPGHAVKRYLCITSKGPLLRNGIRNG